MKHKTTKNLLNILVILGIVLTVLMLAASPFIVAAYLKVNDVETYYPFAFEIIMSCIAIYAIPYVIGLYRLKRICSLVFTEDAFSEKTAFLFRSMAWCSFSEAILFIVTQLILIFVFKIFLLALTVLPLIIVPLVCVVAGLICLAFSGVFYKAASIKAENDLTF